MYTHQVRLEWDEAKRALNFAKHGVDFADVPEMFAGPMLVGPDARKTTAKQDKLASGSSADDSRSSHSQNDNLALYESSQHERPTAVKKPTTKKRSRTNWVKIDALGDTEIDFSDIAEQGKAFFKRAMLRLPEPKAAVTIRLDRQVLNWFSLGRGYQTRINALRLNYISRQIVRALWGGGRPELVGCIRSSLHVESVRLKKDLHLRSQSFEPLNIAALVCLGVLSPCGLAEWPF